jgi:membrane protein CcdC involved in cytochrome C biogenesis
MTFDMFDKLKNKPGKLEISWEFIKNDPDAALLVFGSVIIVRAEHRIISNVIEYEGLSELFDEIPFGQIIPSYKAIISKSDNGELKLNGFERIR